MLTNPKVWHFNFRGPDVERLVAGRERILLDRFYDDLSANPAGIDEKTRDHYAALYARPKAIHDAFSGQFAAFTQDAEDNQALFATQGKLPMPGRAIGADHSFGAQMQSDLASIRQQRAGRRYNRFWPLDHGGTTQAGHRHYRSLYRKELMSACSTRVFIGQHRNDYWPAALMDAAMAMSSVVLLRMIGL